MVEKEKNPLKKHSLKISLVVMMIAGWLIPVTIICVFMAVNYHNGIVKKTESLMEGALKNFTNSISLKLNEAIGISRKLSYNGIVESAWKEYLNRGKNDAELYSIVRSELGSEFHNDKRFLMSCLFFTEEPDMLYFTYRIRDKDMEYKKLVHEEARKISELNSSDVFIKVIDGKLYIIRNLYTTSNYSKFATLTVELNREVLFEELINDKTFDIAFFVNDQDSVVVLNGSELNIDQESIYYKIKEKYSEKENYSSILVKDSGNIGLIYQRRFRDYHIGAFLLEKERHIYQELYELYKILTMVWLFLIPILALLFRYLWKNITVPMNRMILASKEIQKGNFGVQIDDIHMPNVEFEELRTSFNKMSAEIKYLFDYAYNEKLARKDAKILALQSQINPHFLNNTLEMMNWQARMAGDAAVSKMIEALSTLLDYSMDRSNRRLIPLAEELRCADAYFYITSMRFGQRLVVEKEVDESLLQFKIPQLILQPILENAVVHGVEAVKRGTIWLKVFKEEAVIRLEVINTGKGMEPEDVEYVNAVLSGRYDLEKIRKGKHNSLGIRNVNERIQLIYGEGYGLEIKPLEDGKTLSVITIPFEPVYDENRDKMMKSVIENHEKNQT